MDGLLVALKGAVGATYTGWKGGEYVMDGDTPVWVDRYGDATATAVVGVDASKGWRVYLLTAVLD